jgi:RNA polymerase sigma-70 factor (ECF subfamily)
LLAALEALEPDAREVLILRDVEGLTAPEVATVTGVSVQAVKSRLHRARLAVRAHLTGALREATPAPGCPEVLSAYSNMLEGDLDATICARLEQHLTGCAACERTCASLKRSLAICREAGSEPVPPGVQASVRAALLAASGSPERT